MAITELKDIDNEAEFAKKLFLLAKDKGYLGPAQIARGLYDNNECYKLVLPKKSKHKFDEKKDIAAIARRVQDHFSVKLLPTGEKEIKQVWDISSNYLLAYSKLFECSMDYLYGLIDTKYSNLEMADICNKTGLSELAVKKLMENKEICMEEYLDVAYKYGFIDPYNPDADPDEISEEDEYLDTYASMSKFWSEVLESECFENIPENWYRMACALYTSKGMKVVADVARAEWDEMPSWETLESWIQTWETFHPDRPLYHLQGMSFREAYDKEPEWIKQLYREIRYDHLYSAVDEEENYETVYWGCAGKFDRQTLEWFHKKTEQWCKEGPFPNIFDDESK